ncbi:MAG: hypothetical protein RSD22_04890 [Romboutsia sp.]
MRNINKFVAVGLGVAMTFGGTKFIEAKFTSKAIQKNTINLCAEDRISIDVERCAYITTKGYLDLYIPINSYGNIENISIKILLKTSDNKVITREGKIDKDKRFIYLTLGNEDLDNRDIIWGSITVELNSKETVLDFTLTDNNKGEQCDINHPNHDEHCICKAMDICVDHINLQEEVEKEDTLRPEIPEVEQPETPEIKPEEPETPETPETKPEEPEIKPDEPQIELEDKPVILPL